MFKNRLSPEASIKEIITEMSNGNPGAIDVLFKLMQLGTIGIANIHHLDDRKIYGSDIWVAYKDVCKCDIKLLSDLISDYSNNLKQLIIDNG